MFAAILSVGLLLAATGVAEGATAKTIRVSVRSNGSQANGPSFDTSISADGRFVAFDSDASNLVSGDTNNRSDVFVHDRNTGTTTRVSVRSNGDQATTGFGSYTASISADGRFVVFLSGASNLIPGDSNGVDDVFVHDRQTATTSRVSVGFNGDQANADNFSPSISADGRFVAFSSGASNLVSGDANGTFDVFVRDRQAGTTTAVSVRSNGDQANNVSYTPSISADGRYVAFVSLAANLVRGDTNGKSDVFVHDRQTATTSRVSLRSNGDQANNRRSDEPSISADGRYVAFVSLAANLVPGDTNGKADVFVHDRQSATTSRVSLRSNGDDVNWPSLDPSVSADGRYVAFRSGAATLVPGDTNRAVDVFVHNRQTATTSRVSLRSNGDQAKGNSFAPSISADGRYAAFHSYATNLVPGDANGMPDVFIHGPLH
jgi:Tol biopolymer transport system component